MWAPLRKRERSRLRALSRCVAASLSRAHGARFLAAAALKPPPPLTSPQSPHNKTGCTLCAGASIFSAFFMFLLGVLIKSNYQFIGEWYEAELPGHHAPTEDQIAEASRNCFIVGAIYLGWVALAVGCVCFHGARNKVR